jgi:hypothetical protein
MNMTNPGQSKAYCVCSFVAKVGLLHLLAILAFVAVLPGLAAASNLAPFGTGILGFNSAANESPGIPLFHAGSARAINDEDTATHVDNFSAGSDGGQGFSFVGVVWSSARQEEIQSLTLTLAAFGDGGWFGPNGSGPGVGGLLTLDDLTEPVVQSFDQRRGVMDDDGFHFGLPGDVERSGNWRRRLPQSQRADRDFHA